MTCTDLCEKVRIRRAADGRSVTDQEVGRTFREIEVDDGPGWDGRRQLLRYRFEQIDFIDEPVELGFDCPLDLHCTYTRDQLLVALDFMKPSTVREGVKWLPEKNIDVFFVTLNKADKDYSPTTMYNDYSINESLFH